MVGHHANVGQARVRHVAWLTASRCAEGLGNVGLPAGGFRNHHDRTTLLDPRAFREPQCPVIGELADLQVSSNP